MSTVLAAARRGHPGLFWFALGSAALAVVLAGLSVVDPRTVLGAEVWVKPLKFAISFTAYAGTLAWMLGRLPAPALRRTGWLLVVVSVVEQAIITVQAGRGLRSHFNSDDSSGILLYSVMGATIVVLYLATLSVALRFLKASSDDPVLTTAIRAGLGVTLVGLSVGFIMVAVSAHTVGAPDGGPGLPLVGWSTTAGDLRVAHFVGLHGLQALPLVAALLTAARDRFDATGARLAVRAVGAGYTALVLVLTWQALRGQPLLTPDPLTLAALIAVGLGTGAVVVSAAQASTRRRTRPAITV